MSVRRGAWFLGVALVTTALTLWVIDWVLFSVVGLANYLLPQEVDSARVKLLMASRYRDSRLLYVGDSRALTDIDPQTVSATCSCGPGYNAAFSSADPALTRIVVRRLLKTLLPEAVVIGVSQWWLSDGADIKAYWPAREILPPWEVVRFGRFPSAGELMSSVMGTVWQSYHYRAELRATLMVAAGSRSLDFRRGFLPRTASVPIARVEQVAPIVRQRGFGGFSLNGRRADELRWLLGELRDRRLRVLLVVLPLHPVSLKLVGPEVEEFRVALTRLAAESGAGVENLTAPEWISAEDFSDNVHLNASGAEKFSRYLGLRVRVVLESLRHAV